MVVVFSRVLINVCVRLLHIKARICIINNYIEKNIVLITVVCSTAIFVVFAVIFQSVLIAIWPFLIIPFVVLSIVTSVGLLKRKPRQWQLSFIFAGLIYLGTYIMIIARLEAIVDKLGWNPSMFGLGVAIIAIGYTLYSQNTLNKIKEILQNLDMRPGDKIDTDKGELIMEAKKDVSGIIVVTSETKEAAQKRLDEDTKRNGSERGHLFENEEGKWAIRWKP